MTACGSLPAPDSARGVQIPRACEDLAEKVPEPVWRFGDSAKALLGRTTVALVRANDNLEATKACQAAQRATFGKPGK